MRTSSKIGCHVLARTVGPAAALAALLLLAGCATPDVKPFAQQTSDLAAAVSAEETATETRMAQLSAALNNPRDAGAKKEIDAAAAKYASNAKAVDALLTAATSYSTQLVNLASAGETGTQAVKTISDNLQQISSALGAAFPGAGTAVSSVINVIAANVTRVEAQEKLTKAMDAADPIVKEIAGAVAKLYEVKTPAGAQVEFIHAVHSKELEMLRSRIGDGKIMFYRIAVDAEDKTLQTLAGELAAKPESPLCGPASAEKRCVGAAEMRALAAASALMMQIKPDYDAYQAALIESAGWLSSHDAAAGHIGDAATAWVDAHAKLRSALDQCGGLNFLHGDCSVSFDDYKAAVTRLVADAKGAK